jgi:riboflavin synthase alpha subunit
MFTGLVAALAVLAFERPGTSARLFRPGPDREVKIGERVALNEAGLRVDEPLGNSMAFDLPAETLDRTWFAELERYLVGTWIERLVAR